MILIEVLPSCHRSRYNLDAATVGSRRKGTCVQKVALDEQIEY